MSGVCISTSRKLRSCRTRCPRLLLEKLAFSSNNELVVPTTNGPCHWQFQSTSDFENEMSASYMQSDSCTDCSFDMAFCAVSDDFSNTISIWQLDSSDNNSDALKKNGTSTRSFNCVVVSPDSSVVASSAFGTVVTLWRTDTGQRCQTLRGHTGQVTAITFSHDPSIIITSDKKRTVRFWQTATGKCTKVLSMLEFNSHHYFNRRPRLFPQIAVSADLGILVCGTNAEMLVLRKNNNKVYTCVAQYPAPVPEMMHHIMCIEHPAVIFNSVFVSWKSLYSKPVRHRKSEWEHWQIDTDQSMKLHVGNRHHSIFYQEKKNGFIILIQSNWGQKSANGDFAWITRIEERLIWIPKQFRPRLERHWNSLGSILAIGMDANTMIIINFSR